MLATIIYKTETIAVDFSKPIDISIPLSNSDKNPIAWYLEKPEVEPVTMGSWVGKVSEGASTNFNTIRFNPHGHGTHTECLGHITNDFYSINQTLKNFFFVAKLISVTPQNNNGDLIITKFEIEKQVQNCTPEAIIIRTLPNFVGKKHLNYSNTNPPYLSEDAAKYLCEINVQHLLIDLPSIDKEKDGGELAAHKAFWNLKNTKNVNIDARFESTITELIFVPNEIEDGNYLLNLQIASFENDASPSKPVLYKML